MGHAIDVRELDVTRGGSRVLNGLSLMIDSAAITGIIGPSGSGKSTLIRSIAGVQVTAGGSVNVLGTPAGSKSNRSRVAYLTQGGSIYPDLAAVQNVRHFATLSRRPAADADVALARVDLSKQAHQVVSTMSGGQRARVSLASVLVTGADVLLLDEPTVGLDPVLRADLWSLFARLAHEGKTLIVSSHVMDEAAQCDRVVLLRDGAILADGTPEQLRAQAGTSDLDEAFVRLAQGSVS